MIKRNISTPYGRPIKINVSDLSSHKKKNLRHAITTSTAEKKDKDIVIKYKPMVKKIGRNYIEMAQLADFEPVIINASPTLKIHKVSVSMQRIAKLLQRSSIASVRRMGNDIIDI